MPFKRLVWPFVLLIAIPIGVAAQHPMPTFKQLTKNVYVALDQPDGSPFTNAMFFVTDAGVVVIDALGAPVVGEWLLRKIAGVTKKPVRYLVYSHFHMGHIAGSKAFDSSVAVIAHPVTRSKMLPIAGRVRTPTITVKDSLTIHLGGKEIRVWHPGPAHTYGDLLVYIPSEKVLFAGDLYKTGVMANHADGNIKGVLKTIEVVSDLDIDHVVPGHGHVAKLKDLLDYRSMMLHFMNDMRELFKVRHKKEEFGKRVKNYKLPERYRARYKDRNGSINANIGQALIEVGIEDKQK